MARQGVGVDGFAEVIVQIIERPFERPPVCGLLIIGRHHSGALLPAHDRYDQIDEQGAQAHFPAQATSFKFTNQLPKTFQAMFA